MIVPEATMATTREVVAEEDWRREVARMPIAKPMTGLVIMAEARSSSWSRWEERSRNDLERRMESRMPRL